MEAKRVDLISSIAMSTAILIASISASPAIADDGKNYPGSMCVPYKGSTPIIVGSAIGNPSSSTWLYVDCPVVKDAGGIRSGWVRVIDPDDTQDVSCNLGISETFDSSHPLGPRSSGGNSGDLQQVLEWKTGARAADHSYYYYSCRIPPASNGKVSFITSYHINEIE